MSEEIRKQLNLCAMRNLCMNYEPDSCNREKWQYLGCPLMVRNSLSEEKKEAP